MIKYIYIILFLLSTPLFSQELNCEIIINSDRIPGTNKQRFKTLQMALTEFINSSAWTNSNYSVEEKIEANVSIILSNEVSPNQFAATIQVQSRRPVYNTAYFTPTYNFKDVNFQFRYVEHEPLIFNEQNFNSNLVSVMVYYAYLIIGIDEDTFAPLGGTTSFERARRVVELANNQGFSGWDNTSNKVNRYWIIENLLADTYSDVRIASYIYHRQGLDMMSENSREAKNNIVLALKKMEGVSKIRTNSNIVQNFMNAKTNELVDLFSGGPEVDLKSLKSTLLRLAPSSQVDWDKIKSN